MTNILIYTPPLFQDLPDVTQIPFALFDLLFTDFVIKITQATCYLLAILLNQQ